MARKIVFFVLALLFAAFVFAHFAQVEALGQTLARGDGRWIVVAVLLQIAALCNQVALFQALYALVGLPARWRDLCPPVWAGYFVNVVTPSAGMGATALLLDDARRRGHDLSRVTLANTLFFAFNFAVFGVLLVFGVATLSRQHELNAAESAAAATLLMVLLGAGAVFLLALWRVEWLCRVLDALGAWLNNVSRKIVRRELFPTARIVAFLRDFRSSFIQLKGARGAQARCWLHAVLVDGLEILVLAACFAAFPGVHHAAHDLARNGALTPSLLVTGYGIGTLFLVVSVTPQGLGVVEGVMTALFVSLGVPLERAAVAVLAYRGLSLWLPLGIGFLALRWTAKPFPKTKTAQT